MKWDSDVVSRVWILISLRSEGAAYSSRGQRPGIRSPKNLNALEGQPEIVQSTGEPVLRWETVRPPTLEHQEFQCR